MLRLVIMRLLAAVPVLLVVSLVSFGLTLLVPGDIASEMAGPTATASDVARVRAELGLNQPPLVRMAQWYGGVIRGDLGRSILLNQSVGAAVLERLPVTLSLTFMGLALACLIGVPAGLLAADPQRKRHASALDRVLSSFDIDHPAPAPADAADRRQRPPAFGRLWIVKGAQRNRSESAGPPLRARAGIDPFP